MVASPAGNSLGFECWSGVRAECGAVASNRLLRALPLLLAFTLLLSACEQARDIIPGENQEQPRAAEAAFQMGEVRTIDPQNRGDSGAKAAVEAAKITTLMNNFYSAAFLDPAKWQGGQHPDLAPLFTAEAQPGQAANLGNLAMSDLSDKIESVTSSVQNIDRLTFFVDTDGSLPLGLASVSFEAVGKPTADGEDVVIRHAASFWLQREGEDYKISAFTTSLNAAEEAAS
jgi:hypothetical protein